MPLLHYDKLLTSQNVVLDMPFYKNGLCDGGRHAILQKWAV